MFLGFDLSEPYHITALVYHSIALVLFVEGLALLWNPEARMVRLAKTILDRPMRVAFLVFSNMLLFGLFIEACALDHGVHGDPQKHGNYAVFESTVSGLTAILLWFQWGVLNYRRFLKRRVQSNEHLKQ